MCTAYAEEWTWEILLIAIVGAALAALFLVILIYLFVCCCRGNRADVSDGSIILQFRKNKTHTGEGVTSRNQTQAYENLAYSDIGPTKNNAQTGQGVASKDQEHAYLDVGPPRNYTQTGQGVASRTAIYGNAAIAENKIKQRNERLQINGQADAGI